MSDDSTLSSRLRRLIAKTFRAEQLYSSMRNPAALKSDALAAAANDLRAKEWQQAHAALRSALNETLALTSRQAVLARITSLQQQFQHQALDAQEVLDNGTARLLETVKRQEFVHLLKLGLELIQQKARAQAAQVICDELRAVLQPGEKTSVSGVWSESEVPAVEVRRTAVDASNPHSHQAASQNARTNVIPLRRQAGSRGRTE